jgi:hypothetical protein
MAFRGWIPGSNASLLPCPSGGGERKVELMGRLQAAQILAS